MDRITEPPPEIRAELLELRTALDRAVPAKLLDRNLIVATWNIRSLAEVTEKWSSDPEDVPPRDLHSLACIAEILAHFDVIALQEIKGSGRGLRLILDRLGANWGLLLSDPSPGRLGNLERLAFLYDRRKVIPDGLVCELVIAQERLVGEPRDGMTRQFARTPYLASFRSLDKNFTLVNLHTIWGKGPEERGPELKEFAHWIANWALSSAAWDTNLIAVGDFNIDARDSPLYEAFTSTGLQSPDDLMAAPRLIFQRPDDPVKLYDQIAWFDGEGEVPALEFNYCSGGSFDFRPHVLRERGLDLRKLAFMISDHFPLWAEFSVREKRGRR